MEKPRGTFNLVVNRESGNLEVDTLVYTRVKISSVSNLGSYEALLDQFKPASINWFRAYGVIAAFEEYLHLRGSKVEQKNMEQLRSALDDLTLGISRLIRVPGYRGMAWDKFEYLSNLGLTAPMTVQMPYTSWQTEFVSGIYGVMLLASVDVNPLSAVQDTALAIISSIGIHLPLHRPRISMRDVDLISLLSCGEAFSFAALDASTNNYLQVGNRMPFTVSGVLLTMCDPTAVSSFQETEVLPWYLTHPWAKHLLLGLPDTMGLYRRYCIRKGLAREQDETPFSDKGISPARSSASKKLSELFFRHAMGIHAYVNKEARDKWSVHRIKDVNHMNCDDFLKMCVIWDACLDVSAGDSHMIQLIAESFGDARMSKMEKIQSMIVNLTKMFRGDVPADINAVLSSLVKFDG